MKAQRSRELDEMVAATVAYAAEHVPYYQRTWRGRGKAVRSVRALARLPLLDKDSAIAHQNELLADRAVAFAGTISSGTTYGEKPPLRVLHDPLEAPADGGVADGDEGLVLDVRDVHHGLPEGGAPSGRVRIPFVNSAQSLRLITSMLASPQPNGQRFSAMIISAGAIKALLAHLLETGGDPAAYGVREIGTYGHRLSNAWRRNVARAFVAEVFDNYSLSEFVTPALECRACGFNHWTWPPIAAEVVDAFTHRPSRRGTGVLVLTSLYPYVRGMPLIRYWTGDLVTLGPPCAAAEGARGVRCRGRLSQCLVARGDEPILVSTLDLMDACEEEPLVAREAHPAGLLGAVASPDIGAPKFELSFEGRNPSVRIELKCDPNLFADEAHALGARVARHLLASAPGLRALERSKRAELRIHLVGPGGVKKRWSKFA